jgi:hypothetical protein
MDSGYMVIVVISPKGAEALSGQCLVADTEQGTARLQANLKTFRERHGMQRLSLSLEKPGGHGRGTNLPG